MKKLLPVLPVFLSIFIFIFILIFTNISFAQKPKDIKEANTHKKMFILEKSLRFLEPKSHLDGRPFDAKSDLDSLCEYLAGPESSFYKDGLFEISKHHRKLFRLTNKESGQMLIPSNWGASIKTIECKLPVAKMRATYSRLWLPTITPTNPINYVYYFPTIPDIDKNNKIINLRISANSDLDQICKFLGRPETRGGEEPTANWGQAGTRLNQKTKKTIIYIDKNGETKIITPKHNSIQAVISTITCL